jgi:hypothetical protein
MKVLRIRAIGGLGNQLFCFIAGTYLSNLGNKTLELDISGVSKSHSSYDLRSFHMYSTNFKIIESQSFLSKRINHFKDVINYRLPSWVTPNLQNYLGYLDRGYDLNSSFAKKKRNVRFHSGYFQSFQYLNTLRASSDFSLELVSSDESYQLLRSAVRKDSALSMHVRRGDFKLEKINHGLLSKDWYLKASIEIQKLYPNVSKIYIFTNDLNWCENILAPELSKNHFEVVIMKDLISKDPAITFKLLSESNILICSNSTFSLLAAAVGRGTAVVPKPYNRRGDFKVLEQTSPSEWIVVNSDWE